MEPEHLEFGGGVSRSALNPVVLMVVIIVGILICVRARKQVIRLFLAAGILIRMDRIRVPVESAATVPAPETPARLTGPLRPAYISRTPKQLNSYGRMGIG